VQVWNWLEVNKERDASFDDGAAGDHYYGARGNLDSDPDVGLNEIIAEALNASPGEANFCTKGGKGLEWPS
jgi:hypothetical protein